MTTTTNNEMTKMEIQIKRDEIENQIKELKVLADKLALNGEREKSQEVRLQIVDLYGVMQDL